MTDPTSFTAEHRSWQWELVLQYEDGSLTAAMWNEPTLSAVADWYAKNVSREQATARYQQHYHKNRRRLLHRLDGASVATDAIEAVDLVWESLLARALLAAGK
ncbi:MAG: hypothetical protein U0163_10525 [Gemmatimonadaceae bacterium]